MSEKTTKAPSGRPIRLVSCPRCRKSTRYDPANPFRPFCSALCKDEDIISWAEHGYRIPGQPALGDDGTEIAGADAEEDE
jgi:endogenous inhibitor of DNA gyrase (YacG/DUF329 family)